MPSSKTAFQNASWVWLSEPPEAEFYRAVFVRRLDVTGADILRIRVTADAMYDLWLNGWRLGRGPLRGDGEHYAYDVYEIPAPADGNAHFSVAVIPPSHWLAEGEMKLQAGLLLEVEGLDGDGRVVATAVSDADWRAVVDPAFDHNDCDDANWMETPMGAVGYGESIDFRLWKDVFRLGAEADLPWQEVALRSLEEDRKATGRRLVERNLPFPDERDEAAGVAFRPGRGDLAFPLEIPETDRTYFVDHEKLTTGYPRMEFSGGEGRRVRVSYAEVLCNGPAAQWLEAGGMEEALAVRCHNRAEASAQVDIPPMRYYDEFILGPDRTRWEASYLRTWRFLKIEVEAGPPARLEAARHTFSAYPLEARFRFECDDPTLSDIAEVAFRTMRLCLHDHYEDCPYYERLQYAGDTRLQSLLSWLAAGDMRPGEQALRQLAWSRAPHDPRLTQSRYPTRRPQVLPTFAFMWLRMAYDWMVWSEDETVLREIAPRMSEVVEYFDELENGGFLPCDKNWFIDWAWDHGLKGFRMPIGEKGESSIVNLQAAWCLDSAAEVFDRRDRHDDAQRSRELAKRLKEGVRQSAISEDGAILDGPGLDSRSQHAQVWAILNDLLPIDQQHALLDHALRDPEMVKTSIYHTYYLFRAAEKLNRYEEVWPMMQLWRELVRQGCSTFPEEDGRHGFLRSECHAWSAWVLADFLQTILGVNVLGPHTVRVAPNPCGLQWARGTVPFAGGMVEVEWRQTDAGLEMSINGPEAVEILKD